MLQASEADSASLSMEGINRKGHLLSHRTYNKVGEFGSESRPVLRELGRSCFRNHDLDSTAGPAFGTQNSLPGPEWVLVVPKSPRVSLKIQSPR